MFFRQIMAKNTTGFTHTFEVTPFRAYPERIPHWSDKLVVDVATETGWRSPGGDPNGPYTFYHANSVDELAGVMRAVLDAI